MNINPITETLIKHRDDENKEQYQFEKNKLYNYLGKNLVTLFEMHEVYIAGGVITSLFTNSEVNDIDVYFRSEESFMNFLETTWEDRDLHFTIVTSKSVLAIKGEGEDERKVQMIHFKYFESAEDIFDTFDFTVCMGAFDFKSEQFTLHKSFMKHNSQKLLQFNPSTAFPIVSLLRVQKYSNKRYTISKPEFIRIVLKCMSLEIKDIETLKEHLGGMYGINYDKLINLDEGEEFSLDTVIEKIANLSLHDDYFKTPIGQVFNDIEDILDIVRKTPVEVIIINEKHYKLSRNDSLIPLEKLPLLHKLSDSNTYFKDIKFYKWVNKIDDSKFNSFHDTTFIYQLGEVATAKGISRDSVIWTANKKDIHSTTYNHKGVLIEVELTEDEFIEKLADGRVKSKSCKVIREVSSDEWGKWE